MTGATRSRNGTARAAEQAEPHLPVETFAEAVEHLRRPFTARAVKFKVQATWPKDAPTGALIVPYIDARLTIERLNMVIPSWSDAYRPEGKSLWCDLTVAGITRTDIGTGYVGKGLVSDALKRAAVKFGVGVSLYATPKIMLSKSDGHLRDVRTQRGPSLALTDAGDARCRDLYASWLARHGEEAFGPPLDHGDAADSIGDPEAVVPDDPAPAAPPVTGPSGEAVARYVDLAREAVERGLVDKAKLVLRLTAAGARDTSSIGQAFATCPAEEASAIGSQLADLIADADSKASEQAEAQEARHEQ